MRAVIDAILAQFRPFAPLPKDAPAEAIEEAARLARCYELFVAAGAERLERIDNPDGWLQANVRFVDDAQRDRWLAADKSQIRGWLGEGIVTNFFFMMKPPGLRLRFNGASPGGALLDKVRAWLSADLAAGHVADFSFGPYDAETYQFGGEAGLAIAHEWFTTDSLAAMELARLEAVDPQPDLLPILSLTVLSDLVGRVAPDAWERWDTWRNLRLAGRTAPDDPEARAEVLAQLEENRKLLMAALWQPERIRKLLPGPHAAVLDAWLASNQRIGQKLRQAAERGGLLYGPRKILPFYMIFHWNRVGFSPELQVTLGLLASHLLDPKGE